MTKTRRLRQLINAPEILKLAPLSGLRTRRALELHVPTSHQTAEWPRIRHSPPARDGFYVPRQSDAPPPVSERREFIAIADGAWNFRTETDIYETIRRLEMAGAASVVLGDAPIYRFGRGTALTIGKESADVPHVVRVATESRWDPDFVIAARCHLNRAPSFDGLVDRLNAYADAGADLLFADGCLTREQVSALIKGVSKPLCVDVRRARAFRAMSLSMSYAELEYLGVAAAIATTAALVGRSYH